jgi:uncharacterized membrane protein
LGVFIATSVYPMLVLRTVRSSTEEVDGVVPSLSVTLALLIAAVATGVLIYFVHHVSLIIRAPHVVAAVGDELDGELDRLMPADNSRGDADSSPGPNDPPAKPPADAYVLARSGRSGFVTAVRNSALLETAKEQKLTMWLRVRPGSFVFENTPLVVARADDPSDTADTTPDRIARMFGISERRTTHDDPAFPLEQLSEIAQRAMSPGINDPFTCSLCIQRLGAALSRVAGRPMPDMRLRDDHGKVRVILDQPKWDELVDGGFDGILYYARADARVLATLLGTLGRIAEATPGRGRREKLAEKAAACLEAARSLSLPSDREPIESVYAACRDRLARE